MHRRARRPPRRNVETKARSCRREKCSVSGQRDRACEFLCHPFPLTHCSPRQQHAHVCTHACSCSMLLHTFAHAHTTKSAITPSDPSPRYPKTPQSGPKRAHKEATRPKEGARKTKDAEKRFRDDYKNHKMELSCKRNVNSAKSTMRRLSCKIVTRKSRKTDAR